MGVVTEVFFEIYRRQSVSLRNLTLTPFPFYRSGMQLLALKSMIGSFQVAEVVVLVRGGTQLKLQKVACSKSPTTYLKHMLQRSL